MPLRPEGSPDLGGCLRRHSALATLFGEPAAQQEEDAPRRQHADLGADLTVDQTYQEGTPDDNEGKDLEEPAQAL